MSSGVGLAFLVAVGVELAVDPRRRHFLLALVLPIAAFAEWFLAFGAGLPGTPGAPCASCVAVGFGADIHTAPVTFLYLARLAAFITAGLEASLGGAIGSPTTGIVLLPVLLVLLFWQWGRQRGPRSWQLGTGLGVMAWFGVVSLGRAQFGSAAAADPHYVYVGVVFVLPLIADLAREIPWRSLWRPVLTAALIFSVVGNILLLREAAFSQIDTMQTENAELQTLEVFRGAPDMALNRSLDETIMPQLNAGPYLAAVDELGSPVPASNVDSLRGLKWQAVDKAMLNLFGGALAMRVDADRSSQALRCETVDSAAGLSMDFRIPSGQSLLLQSSESGSADLFLGFLGPPSSKPLKQVELVAGSPGWIHIPDTGQLTVWNLRIKVANVGAVRVCGTVDTQFILSASALYHAQAASGQIASGWSLVEDSDAYIGQAAMAARGTTRYNGVVFGIGFLPTPGAYDLYYRLRVASAEGSTGEMTLSLLDATTGRYAAAATVKTSQIGTNYKWLLVVSNVIPPRGHLVKFQTNISGTLETEWFIDSAALVPAGSSVVQPKDG
jgi:hypothetical protein